MTGIDIFQGETLNKYFIYSHETPLDPVSKIGHTAKNRDQRMRQVLALYKGLKTMENL